MIIAYKNKRLERVLIGVCVLTAAVVVASYVCLFGFDKPLLSAWFLYRVQVVLLCVFITEKIIRLFNSASKTEFWRANWFEIPLALALGIVVTGNWLNGNYQLPITSYQAVGIYLVLQVVAKVCRTVVALAASGRSPTRTLIASFLVLIISGAFLLMLPRSSSRCSIPDARYSQKKQPTGIGNRESRIENRESRISFIDALFTATSATCVTGLIVKNTGKDFSLMGQIIILSMIQLGGLGIVVFGAVFALLLGQAGLAERAAMQDLLSAKTLSRIGNMIAFIFVGTIFIEAIGALGMFGMWDDVPSAWGSLTGGRVENLQQQWFCSIFHSISAFCNAGFSLLPDSFTGYNRSWAVYVVICPLIILGGLGFGVLYDVVNIAANRVKRFFKVRFNKGGRLLMEAPKSMRLQSKIVLSVSAGLIVLGMLSILLFERYAPHSSSAESTGVLGVPHPMSLGSRLLGAGFQSITARTAGFNTVDVSAMSAPSKFILVLLMFVGGSPGSTAGGIKTVTLAVVIMTTIAALRKRSEVEMFKRSIRMVVVGRAITVTLLFVAVLFGATLLLSITENANGFGMSDIIFEAGSALGTVGLTTGITASLTTAGKLIIIAVMLIGRLGPLTLLAMLTFNLKPVRYNYPQEAIVVG